MKVLLLTDLYPHGNDYGGCFIKHETDFMLKKEKSLEYIICSLSPGSDYCDKKIEVHHLPRDSLVNLFRIQPVFYSKLIKKYLDDVDVIYAHFPFISGITAYLLGKLTKIPYVLTAHGSEIRDKEKFGPITRFYISKALDGASIITTRHPELYDKLIRYRQKLRLMPPILDFSIFNPVNKKKHPHPTISFVGNLVSFKDPLTFVKSANSLSKKDYNFLIAGAGNLMADVIRTKRNPNIKVLGPVADIIKVYSQTDIFVLPSVVENIWSTALIEAMACGIPCIVTDVGYTRNYLSEKQGCILIPPRDHKSMTKAILELAEDYRLRKRLGKRAASFVRKKFNPSHAASELMTIYEELK